MANAKMVIAPANVNSFKSIFNSINEIVDTISFECYADRVEINTLDKSRTTFISCVMNIAYFDEYVCDEPDRFNIDTTEFRKIIKSCKDDLSLEFGDSSIVIKSKTKSFTIYQVNDDLATPKPPSLDYTTKFLIPIKYLKDMVKDIELFAKDVTIETSENQASFSTQGSQGEFIDTIPVDDELGRDVVKVATTKLSTCLGSDKVAEDIEIQMETDMPLLLIQNAEGIRMTYMVAPLIDAGE